jgi:hypothetical protein
MQRRLLICFVLLAVPLFGQIKDMPTQAEFDPILENADSKLKDYLATLTEFRAEATAINESKLNEDLNAIRQLRQMIQVTHSGVGNHGINLARVYGIVAGLDDVTLDAAAWSALNLAHIGQGKGGARNIKFGMRTDIDFSLLKEVSRQMFHPTFRMMAAADEIIDMVTSSKGQPRH